MYMMYGMSYQDFWYGDPWMVRAYREAFLLKQRKRNEEMWIQGAYIANAVSVALNNGFNKRKIDYMKEPFDIFPKTEAEERDEIRKERQKIVKNLTKLAALSKQSKKGTDQNG